MTETPRARRSNVLCRFTSDDTLHVTDIEGELPDRLCCDSHDLLMTEWRKYLHRHDWNVAHQMAFDLKARRTSEYAYRNIGNNGHRLFLRTRTVVICRPNFGLTIRGFTILEKWESPRTFVFLKAAVKCWPVLMVGHLFA